MGKVQLSDHEKGVIDGMHRVGTSARTIAKSIGRSNRTVSKWIARLKALGHMERQDGSGCPRKTTALQDRRIMLVMKRQRDITVGEIQESADVKHISETTIRRRIKESGEFDFYRTIKKPYVNAKNRRRRVLFAKEHVDKPISWWRKVIWTDESPFVLRHNRRSFVIRKKSEKHKPFAMTGTVKHDKKINVWGCFTFHGVGDFHRILGIMDQQVYRQILIHHMRPSARRLFPDGDFIFQQDNDPKHTARSVKEYLEHTGWSLLEWPAQSPDLNPIENLWSIIDLRTEDREPKNEEELFEILKEAWESMPPDILENLVESMPRRCLMVIDSKGYPIKY